MKKLLFFIILSGIAFKLKAQQSPDTKIVKKHSNPYSFFDTIPPKIFIKPKNNAALLFLPKQKLLSNSLVASLDKMPIVKPVGKWNMPIVKPDRTVIYTTPIMHLPPVIKTDTAASKIHP